MVLLVARHRSPKGAAKILMMAEKSNLCFCGGQHCPHRLLDPPRLSQCEVRWLDAILAAFLLSKVTVRLIFPPVVMLVAQLK